VRAWPGGLLVGADSHSTTAGAVGMLAVGAGGLEVAVAMAGCGFDLSCPRVVQVELTGALPDWVEAKDVILELLRRHGVRSGGGAVFEFTGEGVATLSVPQRATICNMIVETGATGAVFPSDERVREWLAAQRREDGLRGRAPTSSDNSSLARSLSMTASTPVSSPVPVDERMVGMPPPPAQTTTDP
jgi:aconitate hydratase